MLEIPGYIDWLYITVTLITAVFIIVSVNNSKIEKVRKFTHFCSLALLMWLIFMAALAINKYFLNTQTIPPKIAVPVIIIAVVILILFLLPRGKRFIDGLSLETLTWLHVIRIPVEITLFLLAGEKMIPESMTFGGINFDIFSGISAPVIAFLYFRKKSLSGKILLAWNILCLALVLNVVINGLLSVPSPFQQFNLDRPNMAVLYFPYCWLPTFVVPAVIFGHLVAIRMLTGKKELVS